MYVSHADTADWGPNRLLKTRYYTSAFEYFPKLDRNLLYSSLDGDGMELDTWPNIMHLPYDERPLAMTFGDDTEMTRDEKRGFIDVYDNFGIPVNWSAGDVVIVCNYRFAHGRPAVHLMWPSSSAASEASSRPKVWTR